MKRHSSKQLTRSFPLQLLTFTLMLIVQGLTILHAQSANTCEEKLAAAEEKYFTGYFEESIQLVEDCLKEGDLTEETKIKTCKLLSLNFLADGDLEKAKVCVKKLLEMTPDYVPDEETEPREFVELVYTVKLEIQRSNVALQNKLTFPASGEQPGVNEKVSGGGNGKWLLLAAATGGVVSAIVVLAMRQDGSDDSPGNGGNGPGNGRN